jgi:hypothetical protein
MAKKLDPAIAEVLKAHGFGPEAAWDCHGTWVVYHRVLEQIAAQAGIVFDAPLPLETNGANKSVAICVTGRKDGVAEWSIGESAPGNNKNAYPYAMAEKRAKDRVILKLIGLHGLAYSEDEADDFKASAPVTQEIKRVSAVPTNTPLPEGMETKTDLTADTLIAALKLATSIEDLNKWGNSDATQVQIGDLSMMEAARVRAAWKLHKDKLQQMAAA